MIEKKIVNADDFGASLEVNKAIDYAFKHRIINRATLMVNMPFVQDAVNLALRGGYLDRVGLHLCLDAGEPLTEEINEYYLFGRKDFWKRKINNIYISKKVRNAIEKEIEAQIQEYIRLGGTAMHIDSHHHVHHIPSILPSVILLAKKYGFKSMRISRNIGSGISPLKRIIKKWINYRISKNFETNTYFGNMQNYRDSDLNEVDNFEIMVHPCIKDGKYCDWVKFGVYYSLDDYEVLKELL
jgi:predicted glycoside hydrolase/deacetylase ChbG (UPF0249 family)